MRLEEECKQEEQRRKEEEERERREWEEAERKRKEEEQREWERALEEAAVSAGAGNWMGGEVGGSMDMCYHEQHNIRPAQTHNNHSLLYSPSSRNLSILLCVRHRKPSGKWRKRLD